MIHQNDKIHRWFGVLLLGFFCALQATLATAQTQLVGAGSVWKYLDNGSDQGSAWRAPAFDDSTWRSGPAKLGYGDGDEATVVGFGPNASAKFITTYFRRAFDVATPGQYSGLNLRMRRDDGAIVYLNGIEVFRSNMPAGPVTFTTLASSAASDDGATWQTGTIAASALVAGTNVIAVEIHQSSGSSSDISFDLELTGTIPGATSVTRGPYLQLGTPTSIVVRWRTAAAVASQVRYGPAATSLTQTVQDLTPKTEHIVTLTGLTPNTQYFYAIGTDTVTLAGGDADHRFTTHPTAGKPTRIWVLGDAGTKDANQAAVRNAYDTFSANRDTDLWLMLGDNAYENGTDSEYQAAVFDMYKTMLRRSVVWPTIGNHDTAQSSSPPSSLPYFQMFTLPTNGQAGGLASGTPRYYSFDYGDIHFVCLDSMTSDRSMNGPMLTWLRNDLAANQKRWLIAYWHHPPYTKGSHDSDAETIETQMRQNALPILEQYGVDLVLSGHSHSYERSFLIDSHYGLSSTFSAANKKNGGDGRLTGSGAYTKASPVPAPHEGTVYVVAGSSGKASGGLLNHPAMFVSLNNLGSLVLDVAGDQLDAKFLRENGTIADNFTIVKGRTTNASPTVTLTAPAQGASAQAPATFSLTANASDTDGTIARVDFYQGAQLLGSSTASPYQFTWSNVAAGSYALTARATDNAGGVGTSAVVNVTATASATPPAAPSGLAGTAASRSRIDLKWADNATNETSYQLERSTDGTTFTTIATLGANATSFSATGLSRNRLYTFRVRALNAAGASAYSNTVQVRTPFL